MPPNFALNNNSNAKKYARDYSRWLKWTGWMVLYESLIFGFVWLVWYGYADQSKHTEYRDGSYNWGKTPTTASKRQCMVWWWLEVQMEGTKQATLWISFFCCCSNVAFIALSQLFIYIYIREVTIEHCKQTSDQQKMKKKTFNAFSNSKISNLVICACGVLAAHAHRDARRPHQIMCIAYDFCYVQITVARATRTKCLNARERASNTSIGAERNVWRNKMNKKIKKKSRIWCACNLLLFVLLHCRFVRFCYFRCCCFFFITQIVCGQSTFGVPFFCSIGHRLQLLFFIR